MYDNLIIPIFPLSGVIFFPNTNLPLNIFEERYIDMINHALKKDKKIGMIQSKENGELYSVGCLGKITSFEETRDGRYLINLLGQDFFTAKKETTSNYKFRMINISLIKNKIEPESDLKKLNKNLLLKGYQRYVDGTNLDIDLNIINSVDTVTLIKFIAMTSPFSVADKQMLLETRSTKMLYEKLIALFDFYLSDKEIQNSIN